MNKLFIILCLNLSLLLHAEQQKYIPSYLYSYPQTTISVISAPTKWNTSDWLTAAGIIAIGTGLYIYDEDIARCSQNNRTALSEEVSKYAKQFGEGKYILPAIAVTSLNGYVTGSDKVTDTGMLCLKSFILSNCASQALKAASQRYRPEANQGKQFFNGSGYRKNRESFPSGHATVAWSVAPVLAAQYKESHIIPPLVYGIATLTSLSRVHDNKHWASDAFAGSVIGYLGAIICLNTTPRLQVLPTADLQGISFIWDM